MKICFWGNFGGVLKGTTLGGGELQMALLSKALARGGHEVVIIDYVIDKEFQTDDGIKVYPIVGWNNGIKMIRTLTHRLPLLYSCLRDQKADIYYCRIRDFRHIIAWWASRKVKAKFILALAEDIDVMGFRMRWKHYYIKNVPNLWKIFSSILIEIIYPYLIRKADSVFVQHEGQKQMLSQRGIRSILFPNLIDLTQIAEVKNKNHDYFINVGRLSKGKGIVELFNLVEKSPFAKFIIIGQPYDKSGYLHFEKLKTFQNVTLLGHVKHSDTLHHIACSKALISTSHMEGFPNIFIEAWAHGIPVLSLFVDPSSIIEKEELGVFAHGNSDKLLESISNTRYSDEFAEKAKAYVEHNHQLNPAKIEEISSLFREIAGQGKS